MATYVLNRRRVRAATAAEAPTRSGGVADTDAFVATLADVPVVKGSVTITFDETVTATARTLTDDGAGALTGTGGSGTIDYETGAISVSSSANNVDDSTVSVDYESYSDADAPVRVGFYGSQAEADAAAAMCDDLLAGLPTDLDRGTQLAMFGGTDVRAHDQFVVAAYP